MKTTTAKTKKKKKTGGEGKCDVEEVSSPQSVNQLVEFYWSIFEICLHTGLHHFQT
jgi:hypothetical protein